MIANDKLLHNVINIGVVSPITILHVTDAHLCGWNERDGERKRLRAQERHESFAKRSPDNGEHYVEGFYDLLDWGKNNCDLILNTGDTIDLVSYGTLDILEQVKHHGGEQLMSTPGSHEFSQYVGEAEEDFHYKMQSYNAIQNRWPGTVDFCSRVVHGVNFVMMDNSYYSFTEKQYELLQVELQKGYPVVVGIHVPLFHEGLLPPTDEWKPEADGTYPDLGLCGAPKSVTDKYSECRQREQSADADTLKMTELLLHQSQIKLILAGHLHQNAQTVLPNGALQLITDLAGRQARIITLQ